MTDLAIAIIPTLCALFFIWMVTEQLSETLRSLGYNVPLWARIAIITIILVAFATTYVLPGRLVYAFTRP